MFRSIKVRDYMHREAVTLSPETHLFQAIDILLTNPLCSAPVVDASGSLVRVLSESDCLRGILSGAYFEESSGTVRSWMTGGVATLDGDADILKVAGHFAPHRRRRLRVTEQGGLVGPISRRYLLRLLKNSPDHGAPRR